MPLKFWNKAFLTATYLINRLLSKFIDYQTPIYRLLKEQPDYTSLLIFGCTIWPNLRPYNTHKVAFRSIQCVFLGYSPMHKGFECIEPSYGRVYISKRYFASPLFYTMPGPFLGRRFFFYPLLFETQGMKIVLTQCLLMSVTKLVVCNIFVQGIRPRMKLVQMKLAVPTDFQSQMILCNKM